MSTDFKPGIRFLKKMGSEIGKNIGAYAKHYPELTTLCAATFVALTTQSPIGGVILGGFMLYGINGAGRFDRIRDENSTAHKNTSAQLSL